MYIRLIVGWPTQHWLPMPEGFRGARGVRWVYMSRENNGGFGLSASFNFIVESEVLRTIMVTGTSLSLRKRCDTCYGLEQEGIRE